MACLLSSFGQITEPSSRAFWDDFDDEEERSEEHKTLEWDISSTTQEAPQQNELLLLLEGFKITHFGKQILLKDTSELCSITKCGVSLHKHTSKDIIIGLFEENLGSSGELATLLLPYSDKARKVITITIVPKVEYKSENFDEVKDEITFLRGVNSGIESVKELETPNFIAGVAAGISSYRTVKKLPVNSYVAYTDVSELDSLSAAPILKLLKDIGIECPGKYVPKVKDQSHLYM